MKYPHYISFLVSGLIFILLPSVRGGELDGLTVQATLTQIIGTFSTYGLPRAGDTFELNLTDLPREKIKLTRPGFNAAKEAAPYIPFSQPLVVEKMEKGKQEIAGSTIRLSSNNTSSKFIVQIMIPAGDLAKGGKVSIYIYEEQFGKINCMAAAEGVLK